MAVGHEDESTVSVSQGEDLFEVCLSMLGSFEWKRVRSMAYQVAMVRVGMSAPACAQCTQVPAGSLQERPDKFE
jgi:hypothetical protein